MNDLKSLNGLKNEVLMLLGIKKRPKELMEYLQDLGACEYARNWCDHNNIHTWDCAIMEGTVGWISWLLAKSGAVKGELMSDKNGLATMLLVDLTFIEEVQDRWKKHLINYMNRYYPTKGK